MKIIDFQNCKEKFSQREFAKEAGVPRMTLQIWLNRMNRIDADPSMVSFLESPAGVKFLHILIQALHFEFTKVGCASIRNICNFLELTQLSNFVAASYGTHQKISDQMDTIIGQFGDMEKARLSMLMPEKLITLCEDETFHPPYVRSSHRCKAGLILCRQSTEREFCSNPKRDRVLVGLMQGTN